MAFILDKLSMLSSSNRGSGTAGEWLYRTTDTKSTVTTADYFVTGSNLVRSTDTTLAASSTSVRTVDRFKVGDVITVQVVNSSDVQQDIFRIVVSTIDYDGDTPAMTVTEFDESSDVNGPASSTDNAVARWDSTTGTVLQDSSVLISDADAITGVTALTVDNINLNGNTIISTDTNGDLNFSPDGTGTVVIDTDLDVDNINVNGNSIISTDAAGAINITPDTTGDLVLDGLKWPQADGTANQVLKTNGSAQLAWASLGVQNIATTETTLNYTINSETVYSKIVSLGALGSTATTTDAHGITSLGTVYDMRVVADNGTNQLCINGYWTDGTLEAEAFIDDTNVNVRAVGDLSGYTAYATLIYSKV